LKKVVGLNLVTKVTTQNLHKEHDICFKIFPSKIQHSMDHLKPCGILLELVLTDTDTVTVEKRIRVMSVLMGVQHDLSTTEVDFLFLLSA
jgi:hypothetical protein